MIVGGGQVFAQNSEGGWEEIGRATAIRREAMRVPLPAPVRIMDGVDGPESLAWMRETLRSQVVLAVDPAGTDLSVVTALYERRYLDVEVRGRLAPTLGVRASTGKLRELAIERVPAARSTVGQVDFLVDRLYRNRAEHTRARARRAELQRRDRRRARAGRAPLGPYAATEVRVYLPRARIEVRPTLSEVVTATIRAATASMDAAGAGLAEVVAAMSRFRFPNPAAAVLMHPPTQQASEFAAALARRPECDCLSCSTLRDATRRAGLDDELRSVPLTTEQIRTFDPPETHYDRVIEDEVTGAVRLDSSGAGGSWADFLARIDNLIDDDTTS